METNTNASLGDYALLMLEHAPLGIALYAVQDFRLLAANALYQNFVFTHFTPSWQYGEVIGHRMQDWLSETEALTHETIFREVAETSIAYSTGSYVFARDEEASMQWNWSLKPLSNAQGEVSYLLQTVSEMPHEAVQDHHTKQSQEPHISKTKYHQLEVITEVTKSVHKPFNVEDIGNAALDALARHFHPRGLFLHTADAVQRALHVLSFHLPTNQEYDGRAMHYIPYSSSRLLAQAPLQHEPFLINNLSHAVAAG